MKFIYIYVLILNFAIKLGRGILQKLLKYNLLYSRLSALQAGLLGVVSAMAAPGQLGLH